MLKTSSISDLKKTYDPKNYTKHNDARIPKPKMLLVYVGPVTDST